MGDSMVATSFSWVWHDGGKATGNNKSTVLTQFPCLFWPSILGSLITVAPNSPTFLTPNKFRLEVDLLSGLLLGLESQTFVQTVVFVI